MGVVADHRQAAASGLERQQDRGLQAVRVLILIDQDVIEAAADVVGQAGVADHLRPVEQEVVVIENVLLLLGFDIGREQFLEFRRPPGAPWIGRADDLLDRHLGVDAAGVDREAGPFGREAAFGLREALLMPDQVHEVRGVFAVVNREGGVQADLFGVLAQQPGADAVVGAGPGQRVRHDAGVVAHHLARDAFDPLGHLGRGAPGKRHQQDPAGVGALDDQMGDPVGEGVGLSGSRSCDDQQRRRRQSSRSPVLDRTPLLGIEGFEVGGCRLHLGRPFMVGINDGR